MATVEPQDRRSLWGLKEWISAAAVIAGAMAALAHAGLRAIYQSFYRPFGLLPEEVGLGRTELLLQTLAGPVVLLAATLSLLIGLLASLSAIVVVHAFVFGVYTRTSLVYAHVYLERSLGRKLSLEDVRRLEDRATEAGVLHRYLLLSAASLWEAVITDAGDTSRQQKPFVLAFKRAYTDALNRAKGLYRSLLPRGREAILMIAVLVLIAALITGALLNRTASREAERVLMSGSPVYDVRVPWGIGFGELPALQFRAIPARLSHSGEPIPGLPDELGAVLYLGSDGQNYVIYVPGSAVDDEDRGLVVRVPSDGVQLELLPSMDIQGLRPGVGGFWSSTLAGAF